MQDMPYQYRDAVYSDDRTVEAFLHLGTGIDASAADDVTSVSGSFLGLGDSDQAFDAVYVLTPGLATFEGDGIPTSGSVMVAPPLPGDASGMETGLWSSAISSSSGSMSWSVAVSFSGTHQSALRVYTDGPKVTAATVQFISDSGTVTKTPVFEDSYFEVADVMMYKRMVITVTKISDAYRHARIAEIEFGASITLSQEDLAGTVRLVREADPTWLSAPLAELDMEVVNVDGSFDPDNPFTRLGAVGIGRPVTLSFSVSSGSSRYTVPCGTFTIASLDADETLLRVTAFDRRHVLTQVYRQWTVPSDASVGETLGSLLTEYGIPHTVDPYFYTIRPDATVEFPADRSLAEHVLKVQQAFGIRASLSRDPAGTVRYTVTDPGGSGSVPEEAMYTWNLPKQASEYNFVSVGYRDGSETRYAERDLRSGSTEAKKVLQIADNPLIVTEARATEVLNRLVSDMFSEETMCEFRGDPAMDPRDEISFPGKWQTAVRKYRIGRIELEYDGALRGSVRGFRRG